MVFPKPTPGALARLEAWLPRDPRVTVRPMFGNKGAFANRQMFAGIFGDAVIVRLPEAERVALIAAGGQPFEPMPGRPMREYIVLPASWQENSAEAKVLLRKGLVYAVSLPAKPKKRSR